MRLIKINEISLTALGGIFIEVIFEISLRANALPQSLCDHEICRTQNEQRQHQQNHIQKNVEHLFVFNWPIRP